VGMSPADPEWPKLLSDYEAAIAEFEAVSRALTTTLNERNAGDDDFRALILAEERARETVVLARMRLINLWRESGVELEHRAFRREAIAPKPR
jgi:hypothetical protein